MRGGGRADRFLVHGHGLLFFFCPFCSRKREKRTESRCVVGGVSYYRRGTRSVRTPKS
jgi:hypothetical protein